MNDILLIGNDVEFSEKLKGCLKGFFQRKTSVKLLRYWASRSIKDRSRRLIRLSMSTYLDKILKEFKMDQSMARGYNNDPGVDHWTAVKTILSYLKED